MAQDESMGMTASGSRPKWLRVSILVVLLIIGYGALRALNLVELAFASRFQMASGPANPLGRPSEYFVHTESGAAPGLSGVLANWDGQWYERIAVDGYPVGSDIRSPNDAWSWAFPPGFPLATRGLMGVTGLSFTSSAVILNLTLGAVATVLGFCLFHRALGERLAVVAALLLGTFPSSPLFAVSFSEPLALVLILATLFTVVTHRHWWSIPLLIALGLTRPVAAPFALVLALHWKLHHQATRPRQNTSTRLALGLGVFAAAASPFLWGELSRVITGSSDASAVAGTERTTSILKSFDFGWLGAIERSAGLLSLLLFLVLVIGLLGYVSRAAIRLGMPLEVVAWGLAYVAFILVVTPLHPAMTRYLLLATPLLLAAPLRLLQMRKPWPLTAFLLILSASLWLQWLWIRYLYILDPAPALLPFAA